MIRESEKAHGQTYDSNRREFCKKAPCAVLGLVASSTLLTSTSMANTVVAKSVKRGPVVFEISRKKV